MASPKLSIFEPLQSENLQELVRAAGPCITIYLPPYRPGETSPRAQRAPLKDDIHTAAQRLTDLNVDAAIAQALLEPVRDFASSIEADSGFHWSRVIFRSPGLLRAYFVRCNPASNVSVGDCFQLLPALGDVQTPSPFFILKLAQKRFTLIYAGLHMNSVRLPGKTPETLDEFLEMDRPDHDLENRGSVGGPAGGRRIRFGTGSEREDHQLYVADFYKAIDRSVRELLRDPKTPLVLSGVEEDTALYRSIAAYPNVFPGSVPANLPDPELLHQASALVHQVCSQRTAKALSDSKERFAPPRFLSDPAAILEAAASGRVAKLFVGMPAADEDQFNRAAVETVRNSGDALLLSRDAMPDHSAILALLRY